MKLLILGSGGAQPPPRPGCMCKVCVEAREKGIPYYRTGPSIYLPKENILFDLPEDIREQLNREKIGFVKHVFISHWHPDHTMGIRLFEQMNYNFGLKTNQTSKVYMSKKTDENLKRNLLPSYVSLFTKRGIIEVNWINDGKTIKIDDLKITPFFLPQSDTFFYRFEQEGKMVIYAPCDILNFPIREDFMMPDILILHLGFFSELVPSEVDLGEDSFKDNLQTIRRIEAKKTVFMHIEEAWKKSYEDYKVMEDDLQKYNIRFAYDGMIINI